MENLATLNLKTGLHTRLEMDAVPQAIIEAGSAARTIARKLGLGSHPANKLVRAVCEVVLNSCTYAYPADAGKVIVEITCDDNCINVEVVDFGRGFNCGDYFRPDGSRGPLHCRRGGRSHDHRIQRDRHHCSHDEESVDGDGNNKTHSASRKAFGRPRRPQPLRAPQGDR